MKAPVYQQPVSTPPPHHALGIDLSDRRLTSLMNVAVFTPYAIYLGARQAAAGLAYRRVYGVVSVAVCR